MLDARHSSGEQVTENISPFGYRADKVPTRKSSGWQMTLALNILYGSFQSNQPAQSRHSATAAGARSHETSESNARAATYLRSSVWSNVLQTAGAAYITGTLTTRRKRCRHPTSGLATDHYGASAIAAAVMRRQRCALRGLALLRQFQRNNASAASPFGAADSACAQAAMGRTQTHVHPNLSTG